MPGPCRLYHIRGEYPGERDIYEDIEELCARREEEAAEEGEEEYEEVVEKRKKGRPTWLNILLLILLIFLIIWFLSMLGDWLRSKQSKARPLPPPTGAVVVNRNMVPPASVYPAAGAGPAPRPATQGLPPSPPPFAQTAPGQTQNPLSQLVEMGKSWLSGGQQQGAQVAPPPFAVGGVGPLDKVTPSKTIPVRDMEHRTLGCPIVTLPGAAHTSIDSPPATLVNRRPEILSRHIGTLSCTDCRFTPIQRDYRSASGVAKTQEMLKSLPRNIAGLCSAGLLAPQNALTVLSVEDDYRPR